MPKISAITVAVILSVFLNTAAFGGTSLDASTLQMDQQRQEQSVDQAKMAEHPMPGNAVLSRRSKAKINLEQARTLRQEEINKERAAETEPKQ